MTPYGNTSGRSGVVAYEEVEDGIAICFQGGRVYLYTRASVGNRHLRGLRSAARCGAGLATYVSRHVHDDPATDYVDQAAWRAARGKAPRHQPEGAA